MRTVKSLITTVFAALLLQQSAIAQDRDQSQEAVSWIWRCSVEFKTELGNFSGYRILSDEGSRAEPDSADWYAPANGRFGFSISARWTAASNYANTEAGVRPLSQMPAILSFTLGSDRGMPKHAVLRFKRAKGYDMAVGLTLPFDRGVNKQFAFTRTAWDDILAFGSDRDTLSWKVEDTSRKGWHTLPFAEGILDIKTLRAVHSQLPDITARLDAKANNYRNACTREQIEYNPTAEI